MSLASQIGAAVGPIVSQMAKEFGDPFTLRRPSNGTRNPDGSMPTTGGAVVGAPSPVYMIVKPIARVELERLFGRETDATSLGLCHQSVPLRTKDRLAAQSGPLLETGFEYEVVAFTPEPAGQMLYNIGLKRVPALP